VDPLTLAERKVGQRNLHIVEFVGVPPPGTTTSSWAMLELGAPKRSGRRLELVIDGTSYPGRLHLAVPAELLGDGGAGADFKLGPKRAVSDWGTKHLAVAERIYWEGKYSEANYRALVRAITAVIDQPLLSLRSQRRPAVLGFSLKPGARAAVFLRVDAPKDAKPGDRFTFHVVQRDADKGTVHGGGTYLVTVNREARR
jgi:hypothetical protein